MAHIEISILGQTYKIACPDGQEESLHNSVKQFTNKINDIKNGNRALRNDQLIVMAALNFCHELNCEKAKNNSVSVKLTERIEELHGHIDNALNKPTHHE